jgi:hypothetical protein
MAKTFYKFAERSADSQINWAEVGKQLSDVVTEETNVRRDRKAAIDADIASFQDKLNNPPLGEHQGFNDWTTNYAANTQDYALQIERLLKSGKIKTRDYTRMKANLTQGTSDAFDMGTKFQERYAEIVERAKINPETGKPQSQELEQFLMNSTRAMGNYSNSELYIDPPTGRVLLANYTDKKDADGNVVMENNQPVRVLDKNSNSYAPVSQLLNRMDIQVDYYDMDTSLTAAVDGIGTDIQAVVSGGVMTREDALSNDRFSNAVENIVAGQLAIPTNVTSVLTNVLGMAPDSTTPYRYTWDAAQAAANPNLIYLYNDPAQNDAGAPASLFGEDMDAVADTLLRDGAFDLSDAESKGMDYNQITAAKEAKRDAFVANARAQYDAAKEVVTESALSNFDFKETAFEKRDNVVDQKKKLDDAATGKRKERLEKEILPEISKLHTTTVDVNAKNADGSAMYTGKTDLTYVAAAQAEFDTAEDYVQRINPAVSRLEVDGNLVTIIMKDAKGNLIEQEAIDRSKLSQEQFLKSLVNAVVPEDMREGLDIDALIAANLLVGTRTTAAGQAGDVVPTRPEVVVGWADMVESGFPASSGKAEQMGVDKISEELLKDVFTITTGSGKDAITKKKDADDVTSVAIAQAEATFLNRAGISNAEVRPVTITLTTPGTFYGTNTDEYEVVSIMVGDVTSKNILFPKDMTQDQWNTVNRILVEARKNGETVNLNTFNSLGIPNFELLNTDATRDQALNSSPAKMDEADKLAAIEAAKAAALRKAAAEAVNLNATQQ